MITIGNLHLNIAGKEILNGIDLNLRSGDIYVLLEPNGAGKSTTIFALLWLRARDSGLISVLGRDPAEYASAIRRNVGVMPESAEFYDWMTAPPTCDGMAASTNEPQLNWICKRCWKRSAPALKVAAPWEVPR